MTYLIKENNWSLHGGKSRCKINQSDFKLFKTFDTHHEKTCLPGFRPVKTLLVFMVIFRYKVRIHSSLTTKALSKQRYCTDLSAHSFVA